MAEARRRLSNMIDGVVVVVEAAVVWRKVHVTSPCLNEATQDAPRPAQVGRRRSERSDSTTAL